MKVDVPAGRTSIETSGTPFAPSGAYADLTVEIHVSHELSFCPCACCGTLLAVYVEPSGGSYCVRCEVAYLEFKLGLLVAAYRLVEDR